MMDSGFTNGVIAVKEKRLFGERLTRFAEMSAEDVFRALTEAGYGFNAASSVYEFEAMISAEERDLDEFIRTYAPSEAELEYFLAPRDFHNGKALLKAHALGKDATGLLAPDGLVPAERIASCIEAGDFSPLSGELKKALEEGKALLDENKEGAGVQLGVLFERALFAHLAASCTKNRSLKKLIALKADTENILSYLRAADREGAEAVFVTGGTLRKEKLAGLFSSDPEKGERTLNGTPYEALAKLCFAAKRAKKPFSEAEKAADDLETDFYRHARYSKEGRDPFLLYVIRRRAENADVRIILVCLLAGMPAAEIKSRLRGIL